MRKNALSWIGLVIVAGCSWEPIGQSSRVLRGPPAEGDVETESATCMSASNPQQTAYPLPPTVSVRVLPDTPDLGATRTQSTPPPPVSGGTLALAPDLRRAAVADPDRDEVSIVDLEVGRVAAHASLAPGDEPGRVVFGENDEVYVALRSGGGVARVDAATGAVSRHAACSAPRGLALDEKAASLYVACAGGELVRLSLPSLEVARTIHVAPDLRDVVLMGGVPVVSTFRTAQTYTVDPTGRIGVGKELLGKSSHLRWRMLLAPRTAHPTADPVLVSLFEHGQLDPTRVPGEYYGDNGDNPQQPRTALNDDGREIDVPAAVLSVDAAASPTRIAIAAAGNTYLKATNNVYVLSRCGAIPTPTLSLGVPGQVTALAYGRRDALVVQTREPARLFVYRDANLERVVVLSTQNRFDTGHAIFHSSSGNGAACASCHAEGGEDGQVWVSFAGGARKTPSLRGTIAGTAPYHWNGEAKDFGELADMVFTSRMSGPSLDVEQKDALRGWLEALPRPASVALERPGDPARGRALFQDATVGCASCHAGPRLTNNATVDVGTGGAFQVPSLVGVASHPPFLHDGTAATLRDRFVTGVGGGDFHGKTSQLTPSDIDDLVAYLSTL